LRNETLTVTIDLIALSLDNTLKIASKATVVDKNGTRIKLMKGGVLSIINQISQTISWVRTLMNFQRPEHGFTYMLAEILPKCIPSGNTGASGGA
jgi:hypothetical protein